MKNLTSGNGINDAENRRGEKEGEECVGVSNRNFQDGWTHSPIQAPVREGGEVRDS